ncbi:MAG: hypothetical protein A3E68_03255 [Candidatus Levybacteria bacterium RIFCSPHIGHO2_12_FULL_39_39]|nr:MAG: hypothetical protein A2689_01275 [Candidatus Levybacteria bacterium RIFCSPHIGHO2_01_FULL_38_96]OGH26028.1 MAG: hypothetical protein A3E68_03255 [Candidatus Levybacteria bacterium RIFCSPHIGHO2_12_FULL_39_39]OGH36404.1 MAG: hypothetical protein A3B43_01030 [Candidatus Levybacteria bacterium RIFCSPLOWO2_01_FULL_38_120]OGH45038.1 MAG: hypothetical protein A3H82_03060 [Candidatus Levybacteria bacterium RIFCSPLOWO2_02_FULL_39_26]OGH46950.1 MAG: hypothetical protein A3G66_00190 [Candidatus Lev
MNNRNMIVLTYKGKILLMNKSTDPTDEKKHPWSLISGAKGQEESVKMILTRRVKKEMGIVISNIKFMSEFCYHAELTDDHVNHIERAEGQLLDFFTLKEVEKLFLSSQTKKIISKHSSVL